jgi:5'-3' exonuclease
MVSFGVEDFAKKYGGLKPSQFVDLIALSGDRSDNIPGYFAHLYLEHHFIKHGSKLNEFTGRFSNEAMLNFLFVTFEING